MFEDITIILVLAVVALTGWVIWLCSNLYEEEQKEADKKRRGE